MTHQTTKVAIFPGSFDPFTVGHESVVRRALKMFDKIIIAIGFNTTKTAYFPLEKRIEWIKKVFADTDRVEVHSFKGLTVDYCKSVGAGYILRGLRTAADFEYERAIAQVNKAMFPDIETVFFLTLPQHTPINSTIIREIIKQGGDASQFLPSNYNIRE
ncbi:MAG: pantetheine-phosphate adenylyltransferase [Bacteroidales bacterium]|nr:pantetheine-phosphate adenylyltransferase [Bacteroidales bacterium]MBN2762379.1 pantetheine-phosphate adenylyltransferase [Bacteroidales bacterium]